MTRLQPTGEALLTERPLLDDALANLQDDNLIIAEPAVDEYCATLDNYLELSTLLDPILPAHVSSLCALLEKRLELFASNEVNAAKHNSRLSVELPARALYSVIKVRGVKTVSTHLPHTVQNLRALIPTFLFVESHARVHRFWHVRYCVLVWLAVAIRVPFPLHTILDPLQIDAAVRASQAALSETGPVATAAASFSARLLARADAHTYRRSLFEWAIKEALHPAADPSTRTAGLSLLATTFKIAQRDDLQPFIHSVLKPLHPLITFDVASTTVEAHLISKLSQRLALAFLPPRPATWRYSRISRKLFSRNTEPTAVGHVGDVEPVRDAYVSETDAESLEVVIDLLLAGLCHRDTVVRWSAAKGIGRIAARLPFSLALDVITSVTDLFDNPNEARADASWHGACLALAELARRGLLLPQEDHFRISFEVIRKAAAFDVRRGASSVGAHVRDAACYVVWAMARAYARDDVAPFVHVITSSILPVALLDREINCRRAAAAALQECVGRLSELLFADGINLITLADYFSLGDRNAAYLSIAPDVAKLANGTYFHSIVHELWTRKLVHWDSAVRSLSARSLAILVGADKEGVIIRDVIPNLVVLATKKYVHYHFSRTSVFLPRHI